MDFFMAKNIYFKELCKIWIILLEKGKQNKISEIKKLINIAVMCVHFKSWNENVSSIKISKSILNVEICKSRSQKFLCKNSKENIFS